MTYAFLRYRLMDVSVALVRGLTFLVLYAIVVTVPFVVGSRYAGLWQATLGQWWWVAPMVVMGVLASASPVLFLVVVRRLEQRLWRSQRRYHHTLIAASNGMTRVKELGKLCRLIVYVVNRTVGLTNTALLLVQPKQERYQLMATRYKHALPADLVVGQAEPLIALLKEEQELVLLDELVDLLESGRAEGAQRSRLEAVVAWMRQHEVRLLIPSFSQEELLAFLALGPKRAGEAYTTDDIAIFSALSNQATLAIENALFFEELKNNEAYMVQSEKLASLGQLASGMAHEIHNPLTIISGEAQLYLERFKKQDEKVDALLNSIIEECHRAADITRRILRFAKPSPQEFGEVNLSTTLQETLTLAGYQVHLEKVERKVDVPTDLPAVRGNQNQLQEVFLNLVLNACQAMGAQGGKLELVARQKDQQAEIIFADTGPGIPASKLSKIFDPFFTTKSTGTGLGLFVSQRIIRAHGGTLEVQSVEGQGTTFTICLPTAAPRLNGA
jgi:signal transduction histidine kinase